MCSQPLDQRLGGLLRPLVVAGHEDRSAPDNLADGTGRGVGAVVADDAHLEVRRRRADRAQLAAAVAGLEQGHEPFGQAVQLVEATGQPALELLLVMGVQRRADRADHLQRLAELLELRLREQRDQLRRHHHGVRDPLAGDRFEECARLEAPGQDVGRAQMQRRHQAEEGAVEHDRTAVQDHALGRHAIGAGEQRAVVGPHFVGQHDPLGQPGGPARVDQVVRIRALDRHGDRRHRAGRAAQLAVAAEAGNAVGIADEQPIRCQPRQPLAHFGQMPGVRGAGHHHRRAGIGEQTDQPVATKQRAERHHYRADLGSRPVQLQLLHRVVEQRRHAIAFAHAEPVQHVGDAVDARVQLRPRQSRVAAHQRQVPRPIARMPRRQSRNFHRVLL